MLPWDDKQRLCIFDPQKASIMDLFEEFEQPRPTPKFWELEFLVHEKILKIRSHSKKESNRVFEVPYFCRQHSLVF